MANTAHGGGCPSGRPPTGAKEPIVQEAEASGPTALSRIRNLRQWNGCARTRHDRHPEPHRLVRDQWRPRLTVASPFAGCEDCVEEAVRALGYHVYGGEAGLVLGVAEGAGGFFGG